MFTWKLKKKIHHKGHPPPLSRSTLLNRYTYNPSTGIVTHRVDGNNQVKAGHKAGSPNPVSGHESIKIGGILYKTHKIIWYMMTGEWILVDHIDSNGGNNKWINLRKATHQQNTINKQKRCNQKYEKGVTEHGRKFRASITILGKRTNLGHFKTPELAHAAYCKAAEQLHGEFARFR